jgi:hypothetical protein
MMRQARIVPVVLLALLVHPASAKDEPKRAVLIELFSSQGCDSCPSAEVVLGKLGAEGRVIPVAFHVDYFNDPWRDVFSDHRYSQRQARYSGLYVRANNVDKPDYLYFTPMLMVDGRTPMLGSDEAKAREAIRRELAEPPGVAIAASFRGKGDAASKTLDVTITPIDSSVPGRELFVSVVPFTARTSTRVTSGELAGRSYEGHFVARGLDSQTLTPAASGSVDASFSLKMPRGADPKADGVVVIVQDEASGHVHQAARIAWSGDAPVAPRVTPGRRR